MPTWGSTPSWMGAAESSADRLPKSLATPAEQQGRAHCQGHEPLQQVQKQGQPPTEYGLKSETQQQQREPEVWRGLGQVPLLELEPARLHPLGQLPAQPYLELVLQQHQQDQVQQQGRQDRNRSRRGHILCSTRGH